MNGKQAARAAAQRIKELELFNALQADDIKSYNEVIFHMMKHGSPCDYCEDQKECQIAGRDLTIGCEDWLLRFTRRDVDEKTDRADTAPADGDGNG